ncbi:hypothetical protein PRIPAC_75261 [Pristionchus pacificus]|uniref:G protein-coupled receptor n=1 Tax=Pristionchus pacificus TaxID=54126 RepID=A0A2A6C6B3_PRIPA|nr:hypothetical protein PRIPAC_75261 [Pristionchus pacificus]|eukprot:PDM73704.1 G protein-coupled receptor [Pristionchus pacificus]
MAIVISTFKNPEMLSFRESKFMSCANPLWICPTVTQTASYVTCLVMTDETLMIIVNRKSTCLSVLPANLRKSLYPRCLNPSSSLSTLSNTFSSQYAPFSACRCYRILFHWCFSPNSLHLAELHDVHAGQYFPFIIRLVCLIAIDVYMDMLFVMVPLFPAPCGYFTGPLCRLGVPLHFQTGIGFLLLAYLNASILLCVLHRHQSVLTVSNPYKLAKDPRNLSWIMERGCYICLKKVLYHKIFVIQMFALIIFSGSALIFMFMHMNYVLGQSHIKNSKTTINIRKSVRTLFIQNTISS